MARLRVIRGTPYIADEYRAELALRVGELEDEQPLWETQKRFNPEFVDDKGDMVLRFEDWSVYHYGRGEAYTPEEVKTALDHIVWDKEQEKLFGDDDHETQR
jgi:hypothetical protein